MTSNRDETRSPDCEFETNFDLNALPAGTLFGVDIQSLFSGERIIQDAHPAGTTLSIMNHSLVNREKIVQEDIRNTKFKAVLSSVTYGTFDSAPACLVVFDFSFHFPVHSRSRFTYAGIAVKFGQATGATFPKIDPYNPKKDPIIRVFAPVEVWGQAKVKQEHTTWALSIPIVASTPFGGEVGVEVGGGVNKNVDTDHRMTMAGMKYSDDDHLGDSVVIW
ncbi:hypothetical protein H2201_007955 [Coniosporium apollinis]|uniref:Uncharacterized protein n=2 Tax=Coniosporium TaxID=2810619 RepID=A0ABQ9NKD6_9PEZI|nr:hypothetical protein H2199_004262 [Cladosporium sp. JES 115]KAJ9658060.1 hypothetical protein H2201_007955 [Coniosporium apollinis]